MAKKKIYRRKPAYDPSKKPKKPPMSKQNRILLLAAAGVLALAVILFAIFYSDGSLPYKKVVDGEGAKATTRNVVVVPEGENWLIINKGTTTRPKYYKLGTLAIPDAYRLDTEWTPGSDPNVAQYHCLPVDETSPLRYVHVQGVNKLPKDIASEARDSYTKFYAESETSDILTQDIAGMTATYFTSKFGAPDQNNVTEYFQSLTMYLPAPHDSCVLINVMAGIRDMQDGLEPDTLMAAARGMAQGFTAEKK